MAQFNKLLCINMKKLILLFSLLSGCAFSENVNTFEDQANINEIVRYSQSQSGVAIVAKGFYWPSYEGSVICQTKEFETCLFVALNERDYIKYLGRFEKGQFVKVSGRFEWVDLESKKKQFEKSTEILSYNPWHKIVNLKSIVGVKK